MTEITDSEFLRFQRFIFEAAGITLAPGKKDFVAHRLGTRITENHLDTFEAYFRLISGGTAPAETQLAIDSLTTNETYFFREQKHFEILRELARAARGRENFRVWSAACSTGEEPYSLAMVLAEVRGDANWEVIASDISTTVLGRAQRGQYALARTTQIPTAYLKRFCLKGIGPQDGTLLVDKAIRSRVSFRQVNLNMPLPRLGPFDAIFLRNVLIYFNNDTKRKVIERLLPQLADRGLFCVGHSETLHEFGDVLRSVAPATYRKRLPGGTSVNAAVAG